MRIVAAHESIHNGRNGPALRVALVYMYTGFVLFLAMGLLGLLMRMLHAEVLRLPPQWYYQLMTLHGAGMVAAALLAAMGGVIAATSNRLAHDLRWLWTAYILYFVGVGLVPLAVLVGGFAAGWTIIYPLGVVYASGWTPWSAFAFLLGYLLVALGFAAYCIAMLQAVLRRYRSLSRALGWPVLFGRPQPGEEVPYLQEVVATVVGVCGLIAVLAGAAALVPYFGHNLNLTGLVNPLFVKEMIFLFGHTLVNLNIYLAAGLAYASLPAYTGRPWKTTPLSALGVNLVLIFVFLPYFHHLYQDFAQPVFLSAIGQFGSYGVGVPALLITVFGGLTLAYRSGMRWAVPTILMFAGFWGWVFGGIGAVVDSTIAVNQVFHNTLWVPAHFHTYYLLGAVALTWAYLYHLASELSGKEESRTSRLAAWLYGIGGAGFVMMFFTAGAAGQPRRVAVPIPGTGEQTWAFLAVLFVFVLALGLLWLTYDLLARLGPAWARGGEHA
ncbi:MAG: cbb3-type cytochrome c oxidase subunit I [bacterium]